MKNVKTTSRRLTPSQREALEYLVQGKSLGGRVHGTTYDNLRRMGLIEDSYTITDAGRAALAGVEGRRSAARSWAFRLARSPQTASTRCPPGPDRWKLRSTTYKGIAQAKAQQWGAVPQLERIAA